MCIITITSSRWRHLHFEASQCRHQAVFYRTVGLFTAHQVLNSIEENEQVQQIDLFKRLTETFIFQLILYIHFSIYPIYTNKFLNLVQRWCWLGHSSSTIFSHHQHSAANFLTPKCQTSCIVGLVKRLHHTLHGCISMWMALTLRPSPFDNRKR